jgi:hypothetical protein
MERYGKIKVSLCLTKHYVKNGYGDAEVHGTYS